MLRERLPFEISKTENFYDKFNEWIGDVFYDILPEKGFELRDEQVFMAFQLERAFKEKAVVFAEAGVGTGKTIVYLLYAICYARYVGKPAIISCADESLIEQLVKKEGDIAKLSEALELNIDVRLAKSQDQYLCLQKLDKAIEVHDLDVYFDIHADLPEFVGNATTLQNFYHYGDRKDYPHLTDEEWQRVGWDTFQDCFSCPVRHRCGQTLSRDHYRKAADIIICSHDFYMEHIWTIDSRKREGQLPLLPEASCVVFDEGHLLEYSAQKALTYRVNETVLETLLTRVLENDIREELALSIEDTLEQNSFFFDLLRDHSSPVKGSSRKEVNFVPDLIKAAKALHNHLIGIGEGLVYESQLFTIDHYELNIVDEYIDQMEFSINLLLKESDVISWVETDAKQETLVIMPRAVKDVLSEKVFSKTMPFIFSSATLSEDKSFDYIASSLGIKDYQSFSVASPFDYDEQMKIFFPKVSEGDKGFIEKFDYTLEQIKETNGRALILFNSKEELALFKNQVQGKTDFSFLFEGEKEISELVSTFQNNEESILCSVNLWEGLDIPGPSLSNVIIWSVPFPPNDPVFQAKRKSVNDPFLEVDVPYMILRLRQGIGRLIRTHQDQGIITIFGSKELNPAVQEKILNVLPTSVQMNK
ncbi:ATP-dependent DNA helicase [Litchfieldia salsa]|uniref:ATP-dependent DNA helicase DinG n=1 Tax=Litchfieldia salsa TaxID=930152 RepID=A0A1H0TIR6_9BACI|nr:ATP-dependent DNA helicase [Litchfieldia salsa]SDP53745.1 ATP-dependent DNA helicase DinG [Litchfieldia salsa]